MFKRLLSKLAQKTSKNSETQEHGRNNTVNSNGHASVRSKSNKLGSSKSGSSIATFPTTDTSVTSSLLNHSNMTSHDIDAKNNASYEALPGFKDVPHSEKQNLFIRKLKLCCVVFDFSDETKHVKEKEIKRQTLFELLDYIASVNSKITEGMIHGVIEMVSIHIFRSLSPQPSENIVVESLTLDDEEPLMDPAWPHLQVVYDLFLRFVASPEMDAKLAKRYIDQSFILRLLDLFESEDPREREYLKTILHRIYGKFMVHRQFIRKSVNNIFFHFIYETEKHNGIAELLETLGSIVNGFALPLKEEHKLFLVRALIPLHKPRSSAVYHQQLSYCIIQFVEKDCKLADTVIRGLLKYWPLTNSTKEVLFLGELEEVLEATQSPEFQRCMVPLFRSIARCLNSSHFQVAERALFLWNNDHIDNLIKQNCKVILPIIFPALEKNIRNHWNQAVHSLTLNVQKIFRDIDPELFKECLNKFQEDEIKEDEIKRRHEATWKCLEERAADRAAGNEAFLVSCETLPRIKGASQWK